MVMTSNPVVGRAGRRYLRQPVPLLFRMSEEVPEDKLHVELRTALYQLIGLALGDRVIVTRGKMMSLGDRIVRS